MFVTSPYNLFELFKAKYESRKRIISFLNAFPLGIMESYPQLIEFEKEIKGFNPNMIMFVMESKSLLIHKLKIL